jgi:DNA-nicking Smr family endonuclease
MQKKNRKLDKEELDLWKDITKNDIKFNSYVEDLQEKTIIKNKEKKLEKTETNLFTKFSVEKNLPIAPIQVNKRMRAKLERGIIRPEDSLDLHGYSKIQAKNVLHDFIKRAIDNNKRCVLIITGKKNTALGAKGILRKQLPSWLKENSLARMVLLDCYASIRDGADGARYVLLRKKEKVENE